MKRIIGPLTLAALLSAPCLAQAEGIGLYVAPKLGFGWLQDYDARNVYWDDEDKRTGTGDKVRMSSDPVFAGGIAVGYDFKRLGAPVRAELEYTVFGDAKGKRDKRHYEYGGWDDVRQRITLGVQTLFVNGYYDFHNRSAFTPYAGLGLGLSFVDMKANERVKDNFGYSNSYSWREKSTTNFAWNLSGGVHYAITQQIGLDLGYRLAWIGKGETKKDYYSYSYGGTDYTDHDYIKAKDLIIHQVMFGMRYAF